MTRYYLHFFLIFLCIGAVAPSAQAQDSQQVVDLNRQAMDAYNNLELEQAQALLQQALSVAQQGRVHGSALARTYLNLGVVAVGGFGDNGRGLNFFQRALQVDAGVQLDPLTSTPEIQTVFNLARAQSGQRPPQSQAPPRAQPPAQTPPPSSGGGTGTLPHQAVPEQLSQTPVPVYIEVPGDPAHVYLYYKGHGMREFRRVEMARVAAGFGYEIPCDDVFEPSLQYYIVAFAGDGSPLGFAGTQAQPYTVNVVSQRSIAPPALPGRAPPETCHEHECPPGMSGCTSSSRGGSVGAECGSDSECSSGLSCIEYRCAPDEESEGRSGGSSSDDEAPRFFARLGGTLGIGFASGGMQADSAPSMPLNWSVDQNTSAYIPANGSAVLGGATTDCNLDPFSDIYCVRVAVPGFVPNPAIRLEVGYYVWEFIGLSVNARFAPDSGQAENGLPAWLWLGGRLHFRVTPEEVSREVDASVYVGSGVGQIQIKPPDNEGANGTAPYIISGLNGVQVGANLTYRPVDHFGLFVNPELMFQFPTFLFNIDLTAGIEVGF